MQWLVGVDPMSDRLAVLPYDQATRDIELINAVQQPATVGEARQSPLVRQLVEKTQARQADDGAAEFASLPDDTPFSPEEWLGDYWHPLVRIRTAELAPQSLLANFGREDQEVGMDYERATWFSVEDRAQIEGALRTMGDEVVHDDQMLSDYLG